MTEKATRDNRLSRKRRSFNLRDKVLLIFLVLALAPLMIIGRFSIQTTEDLIVSMVIRQLENVAVDKVAILERWLDERRADLMVVAGTSLLKSMNPEVFAPYLNLMREKYGVYNDLTVVSATGEIVFSNREGTPHREKNDGEIYKVRDAPHLSSIAGVSENRESYFHVAAPVINDDGELAGTVYGRVGTHKIIFFILNVSLGETGECYLVDKDGRFLAHKEPHRILTENISQSDSFRNIFEKRDHKKAYRDYRHIEVLGTSLNVGGTDWTVVVEQDREEAFQSANTLKRMIYLTVLLSIGSVLVLTWAISYHIVRPIRNLSNYAEILADSRFDQTLVKIGRNDEIGMLYRAVEDMSRRLQERQDLLEQRVGLREAELKETGLILKKTRLIAERSEKFAAMGRMGAAVAHEIRTPLTSLKLFLESDRDHIAGSSEDEEDFRVAMKQIDRIEATINRFLDFTKPRDLVFSAIDIATLVEDVLIMVRPLVNRQGCSLDVRLDDHLPPISGDKKRLSETLVNLLVNALEAMSDHGVVSIRATRDRLDLEDGTAPCVRIDIGDTGSGIAEDRFEAIFEPFFTTKASGTGLGLPLVLNTIRDHGGVVKVKSRVNQGTLFSLFLPQKFSRP